MLAWFRDRAPRIAAVAMASFAALLATTAMPHADDCHDSSSCVVALVEHDADDHRVVAPAAGEDVDVHCLACHWARSFRLRGEVRHFIAPVGHGVSPVRLAESDTAAAASATQPPLRAPPAPPSIG